MLYYAPLFPPPLPTASFIMQFNMLCMCFLICLKLILIPETFSDNQLVN